MDKDLRDGFKRFDYECPGCGALLGEFAESCPDCGQNLFEVFSGTYTPGDTLLRKALACLLLVLLAGGIISGIMLAVT